MPPFAQRFGVHLANAFASDLDIAVGFLHGVVPSHPSKNAIVSFSFADDPRASSPFSVAAV
jgi:hypothetical protein